MVPETVSVHLTRENALLIDQWQQQHAVALDDLVNHAFNYFFAQRKGQLPTMPDPKAQLTPDPLFLPDVLDGFVKERLDDEI